MTWLNRLSHIGIGMMVALTFPLAAHRKHETPRCPDQPNPRSSPRRVGDYIRCVARAVPGFDLPKAIEVASCESGLDPKASNGPYRGVFQHDIRRWSDRARLFGYAGHPVVDPVANIWVTARAVQYGGWGPWSCA